MTDPDMHLMVEKGMRGGISNICHRHATSNHPSMERIMRMKSLGRSLIKMLIRYTPGQCHKCFLLNALNRHLVRLIF